MNHGGLAAHLDCRALGALTVMEGSGLRVTTPTFQIVVLEYNRQPADTGVLNINRPREVMMSLFDMEYHLRRKLTRHTQPNTQLYCLKRNLIEDSPTLYYFVFYDDVAYFSNHI